MHPVVNYGLINFFQLSNYAFSDFSDNIHYY